MSSGTHTSLQASGGNGQATPHDLFVLTDEQILEIEPEPASSTVQGNPTQGTVAQGDSPAGVSAQTAPPNQEDAAGPSPRATMDRGTRDTVHAPEPPAWLAAQMRDPWSGEEASELWNGVVQARQEAAAYRVAFATPEDARALKELYPGGIAEARAAAGRARLLEEIDGAYFGAAGHSPQEVSAARANLAQQMLREDPAAFREMVVAGLRALEEAEKGSGAPASTPSLPRLAQIFAANRPDAQSAVGATLGSPLPNFADVSTGGASPASAVAPGPLAAVAANGASSVVGAQHAVPQFGSMPTQGAHPAGYAAFEKAANDDLERSVGAAIERTLQRALPNLQHSEEEKGARARSTVSLCDRLAAAVRQDVESALKGDRQLGDQIAQILSAQRFDNETRAQVVRLIDDRARQLVPSAAKRVINDWTQTTLAAHRSSAARADAASTRREVEPALAPANSGLDGITQGKGAQDVSPAAFSSRAAQTRPSVEPHRNASRSDPRRVDYRKLSDEQILEM